uniref:Uncharacterized protein n=1 Tax=Heterorhabditis bacteriophora TaxID=37862 RepID=A0A1I7WQB1_HETBA
MCMNNGRGIAMPLFIKGTDRVEVIWSEVITAKAMHDSTLRGKALFHKGADSLTVYYFKYEMNNVQ